MTIQRPRTPRTLLCLLLLTLTPLVLADCYYANNTLITGAEADNYHECSESGACCFTGETCLPNKLCVRLGSLFSRQACQFKQWPKDKCSLLCPEEGAGVALTSCSNGRVCCGSVNTDCCESGGGVLVDLFGDEVAPVTMTIMETSTATTSLQSVDFTGTQTQKTHSDATADALATAEDTSSTDHSTQMTPAVIGGIAAGAIAVVLALIVVAWVFVREKKKKNEGGPSDRDLQRAVFSAREREVDYKPGYASPVASGLRELPRGYMRPEPRDTKRFELDGRGFGSEEAVGRVKY